MRVLFLGEIGEGQTSLMRMRAIERLGHDVQGVHTVRPWQQSSWLGRQLQRRLERGSVVDEINRRVLEAAKDFRPDLIWAEKQEFLRAETIESLQKLGTRAVHFTPDPYFSLEWKRTRLMNEALRVFDGLVYCKSYEEHEYQALGKPVVFMALGYCDEVHRPMLADDPQWACAVGFLGGWEPRREHILRAVAESGMDVHIRGRYWGFLCDGRWTLRRHVVLKQLAGAERFRIHRDRHLGAAYKGDEVYSDDYARALTGARIGLGLLRKVCPDQHTTRTFEIPACGSMLVADRTDEHQELFEEGREAEFFDTTEELLDKLDYYDKNDSARRRVAEAGRARCEAGRYTYVHRLADAFGELQRLGVL